MNHESTKGGVTPRHKATKNCKGQPLAKSAMAANKGKDNYGLTPRRRAAKKGIAVNGGPGGRDERLAVLGLGLGLLAVLMIMR